MPKFAWGAWDYDCDGDAYIIAKDACPDIENVPKYICEEDCLSTDCMDGIRKDIKEGWAKYQIRRDWDNCDGEACGGYYVVQGSGEVHKRGWFPVWIVRNGEWY